MKDTIKLTNRRKVGRPLELHDRVTLAVTIERAQMMRIDAICAIRNVYRSDVIRELLETMP